MKKTSIIASLFFISPVGAYATGIEPLIEAIIFPSIIPSILLGIYVFYTTKGVIKKLVLSILSIFGGCIFAFIALMFFGFFLPRVPQSKDVLLIGLFLIPSMVNIILFLFIKGMRKPIPGQVQ